MSTLAAFDWTRRITGDTKVEISLPHTFVRRGDKVVHFGLWYVVTRVATSGIAYGIRISMP